MLEILLFCGPSQTFAFSLTTISGCFIILVFLRFIVLLNIRSKASLSIGPRGFFKLSKGHSCAASSFLAAVILFSGSGDHTAPLSLWGQPACVRSQRPSFVFILICWRIACIPFAGVFYTPVGSYFQITPEGFGLASAPSDSFAWYIVSVFYLWPLDMLPCIWLCNNNICVYRASLFSKGKGLKGGQAPCYLFFFFC